MKFKAGNWIINRNLSIIYHLSEDVDFGDSREVVSRASSILFAEKKRPHKRHSKVLKDVWIIGNWVLGNNQPILLRKSRGWHLANKHIIKMCEECVNKKIGI